MYDADYEDDKCEAAPGVMGHLSCNKSCCRNIDYEYDSQPKTMVVKEDAWKDFYKPEFIPNPNFYHKILEFKEIIKETETAYFIRTKKKSKNKAFWVPKKLIRKLDLNNKTCLIYSGFNIKQIQIVKEDGWQ